VPRNVETQRPRPGEAIGRGGSGVVYRARLRGRQEDVAVKMIVGASDREWIRFQKELHVTFTATQRCEHVCQVCVQMFGSAVKQK
jgi:serine/threonine protein kinase